MAKTKDELVALAKAKATEHGLDPALFCALVETESDWYTSWASRYEEGIQAPLHRPHQKRGRRFGSTSYATEREHRSTSFGLCQVMGQVARELGCKLPSLVHRTVHPEIGLEYGAKRLKKAMDRKLGDVREALAQLQRRVRKDLPGYRTGKGEELCLSQTETGSEGQLALPSR